MHVYAYAGGVAKRLILNIKKELTDNGQVHPMADGRSGAHLAFVNTGVSPLWKPYLQNKVKVKLGMFAECLRENGILKLKKQRRSL